MEKGRWKDRGEQDGWKDKQLKAGGGINQRVAAEEESRPVF